MFDRSAYQKAYRERNREKLLTQQRAWREANQERIKEYREAHRDDARERARQWREANAQRHKRNTQRWVKENADRVASYQAQYREENRTRRNVLNKRRMQQVAHGDLTLVEWESILEEFDHRCAYCQGQGALEIEHMTPLSRGGRHTADNVVPACRPCNARKYTSNIFEFLSR